MRYRCTSLLRLSFVALVVLFTQLSLSISPVLGQDIKIGAQVWTSKNLDVSTFRNGEPIPEAKNAKQWAEAREKRTAAFCYYDFDSNNGKVYGKLYNWHAVNDSRGLAPKGYHIPSDAEWTILIDKLGGENIAGQKMKSTTGWYKSGNGNNRSGFNALPNGNWFSFGGFVNYSFATLWWSSTTIDNAENIETVWCFRIDNEDAKVARTECEKFIGLSVRCLKN